MSNTFFYNTSIAKLMLRQSANHKNKTKLIVTIYSISILSSIMIGAPSVIADESTNDEESSDNSNPNPYLLPFLTGAFEREPVTEIIIDEYGNYKGPNVSMLQWSFYDFHIIRLRLVSQNNRSIDLFVEESINDEVCRRGNPTYSFYPKLYLLRTNNSNLSSEANGNAAFWSNPNGTISAHITIFGEYTPNFLSQGWRIELTGNSNNSGYLSVHEVGAIGSDFYFQELSNHLPEVIPNHLTHSEHFQSNFTLFRVRLIADQLKNIEICRIILQAENILRHQLGIQLVVERIDRINPNTIGFSDPTPGPCEDDKLLRSIKTWQEILLNEWNTNSGITGNLFGVHTSHQLYEAETYIYMGSVNDLAINYTNLTTPGFMDPVNLSCASTPIGDEEWPLGTGWALLDYIDSFYWNSAQLFTRMLGIILGASENAADRGITQSNILSNCFPEILSPSLYHQLMINPWHDPSIKGAEDLRLMIHDTCYGPIPQFSSSNIQSMKSQTSLLPFSHIQPDWSEHNDVRLSQYRFMKLRTFFLQNLNVPELPGVTTAIVGDQSPTNWTIGGGDPIWKIRWVMEPTSFNNSLQILPGYTNGTYRVLNISNLVIQFNGIQSYHETNWMGSCNPMSYVRFGNFIVYEMGHFFGPGNLFYPGMIQCNRDIFPPINIDEHIPSSIPVNQGGFIHWSIIPVITVEAANSTFPPQPPIYYIPYIETPIVWNQLN